jgi:hypothetical protein
MTSTSTLNRVERACAELHHDGHPVTFTAAAARTGLGRTTLYRDLTLRAVIEETDTAPPPAEISSASPTRFTTLRTALDTLATRVRRHEEQLRRLTARKG